MMDKQSTALHNYLIILFRRWNRNLRTILNYLSHVGVLISYLICMCVGVFVRNTVG